MKEVSKEVFENIIFKLDVCYTPMGEYPYWDKFTFKNGEIAGTKKHSEGYMISDELYERHCRKTR